MWTFASYTCGSALLVLNLSPKSRFLNVFICSDAADPPPTTANGLLEICAVSAALSRRPAGVDEEVCTVDRRRGGIPPSRFHPSITHLLMVVQTGQACCWMVVRINRCVRAADSAHLSCRCGFYCCLRAEMKQ